MIFKSLLAAALLASISFGAPITISTGVAPWMVNSNPAVIENPIPTPTWISNFGGGSWIGSTALDASVPGGALPGTFIYTLNIGSFFGGPGSFSLQYAADNSVVWTLSSGSLTGTTSCDASVNPVGNCFGAGAGAPRPLGGNFAANSVLTATVVNGGTVSSPMGLLAVGSADNAVPEPSTYAMFAMGIGAIVFARSRRK